MAIFRGNGGSVEGITESDTVVIAISQGGTGATTASGARTNLGLGTAATTNSTAYATAAQGALADSAVQPGDLGTVATSNDYEDLDNLPTLGTAAATDATDYATAAQGSLADSAVQPGDLATVATSGDYDDLTNKPTVPTDLNSLTDVVVTTPSTNQVLQYNGTNWVNGAVSGSGTVTSVAMSVPTGLSVSGSPITSSGTLALTYASGYSIPTTTSQTNWDTAYGWGNHASAGYLTSETYTGTVTSVNLTAGTGISVSGGPVTSSGSITVTNSAPMTYPSSGVAVSTGSAWNTPLSYGTTAAASSLVQLDAGGYANTNNTFGFKNRIINGAMMIDQRNAGASVTPTDGAYTLDRWNAGLTQASKFTVQQSSTAPTGFVNSLLVTSSSAYSVGSGDLFRISQYIEGLNAADFAWGTASAVSVTLSFWVRSSLTGTFGGSLANSAFNRSYPFTYTISSANTWEQKTVTIAGDTSGTWLTTNGIGIRINFSLGAGSSFSGTSGAWASSTLTSATGATSVVGTNGATFYITGVQLEKGSTATSFDYRPYGTELALCQRYYFERNLTTVGFYSGGNGQTLYMSIDTPVAMRATPTSYPISGASNNLCNIATAGATTTDIRVDLTSTGAGQCYSIGGIVKASAEL